MLPCCALRYLVGQMSKEANIKVYPFKTSKVIDIGFKCVILSSCSTAIFIQSYSL